MRLYGLIGKPLTHSFSKSFFAGKFIAENIKDCIYENFELQNIDELSSLLIENNLCGFNITIPYKEQVMPFLHQADELVKATGACNCVNLTEGKLYGYNTDVTGFHQALQPYLMPHHTKALVLGTGGAAKAVAYVLEKLGISCRPVSRSEAAGVTGYADLTGKMIAEHTVIINTTPLGMFPHTDSFPPIPYRSITPEHLLFDLTYNPEKTVFLQKGEERGAIISNGYKMLVLQAEESWKIWNQ